MKIRFTLLAFTLLAFLNVYPADKAGEPTIYVTTLSTGHYHTGMAVPLSALFYKPVNADSSAWQYLGRPNNRIYHFARHAKSGGKFIAMATHTGIHQSADFGKTWKVTSGWQITEASHVEFAPDNPDIIYCSSPYGFYKSIDGGKTWLKKNKGLDSINAQFVSSFIIDSSNPSVLYCSTEDVLYKSVNGGESWEKMGLRVPHCRTIIQHPKNPEILIAGTENNGLYFSFNGGKTWEKRDTGMLSQTFYTVTFDPSNPDIIYAAGFQTGVYKSIDGGKKWKQYFHGLTSLDIHAIAVDPKNSNTVFAGTMGDGLFRSDDGGKSWQSVAIAHGYVTTIKIDRY